MSPLGFLALATAVARATPFIVDPSATVNDDDPHSHTLLEAQHLARGHSGHVVIQLRGGDHFLSEPFLLNGSDSFTTYVSSPGPRPARFLGAVPLPASAFSPVSSSSGSLLVADLRDFGITNSSQLGGQSDISGLKVSHTFDPRPFPALTAADGRPYLQGRAV